MWWRALAIAWLLPGTAFAECTLMPVRVAEEAELVIYFTKFEGEDETGGRFSSCAIVGPDESEATTQTFWISPFRQDADWVVHPSNWPES